MLLFHPFSKFLARAHLASQTGFFCKYRDGLPPRTHAHALHDLLHRNHSLPSLQLFLINLKKAPLLKISASLLNSPLILTLRPLLFSFLLHPHHHYHRSLIRLHHFIRSLPHSRHRSPLLPLHYQFLLNLLLAFI